MSAELTSARTLAKNAAKSDSRKIEDKFRDLCHAVEKVIAHLQKMEKEEKQ